MPQNQENIEQPPVEQPPVEQPPVDQPPVEQPPVDQPPVEQPPVDQPPMGAAAIAAKLRTTAPKKSARAVTGEGVVAVTGIVKDKSGRLFDRRFCVVARDGSPRMTPGGLFLMKRDQDGKQYSRDLLKLANGQKNVQEPLPELNIPGDLDESAAPEGETGAAPQPAGPSAAALEMAFLIDTGFWTVSPVFAGGAAIKQARETFSQHGIQTLAISMDKCGHVPETPWWAAPLLLYSAALSTMLTHDSSKAKVLSWKEKFARWWLNLKHRWSKPAPEAPKSMGQQRDIDGEANGRG